MNVHSLSVWCENKKGDNIKNKLRIILKYCCVVGIYDRLRLPLILERERERERERESVGYKECWEELV